MSKHLTEGLNRLFQLEIESQSLGEPITWEFIAFPGIQMGPQGQPVMGPPKGALYLSTPNIIIGGPPLVLSGEIGKDLFNLTSEDVTNLVTEMIEALRKARSDALAQNSTSLKKITENGRNR